MTAQLPLLAFIVLWSSGYVVGALGVDSAPPLGLLALRFVLAILVAVPLAVRVKGWRDAPLGRLAVVGLLLQGVQFAGVYSGLSLGVPASLAALIVLGLTPVVTTAIATVSGMERPSPAVWAGLVVGVLGVGVSLAPELGNAKVGAGAALTVVGMLGLAGGTVLQKRWVGEADPKVSVAVQIVAASAALIPLAAITGQLHFHASFQLGWTVVYLAVPLSIGATLLLVHLLGRFRASTTSSLLLVVPAVTAVMSALVLGESLHLLSLVGMAISMVAVGAVVRRESAEARPTPEAAECRSEGRPTRTPPRPRGPRRLRLPSA